MSTSNKIGNPHLEKSFGKKVDTAKLNEIAKRIQANVAQVPSKKPTRNS